MSPALLLDSRALRTVLALLGLWGLLAPASALGQPAPFSGLYEQTFDGLGTTGLQLPAGWTVGRGGNLGTDGGPDPNAAVLYGAPSDFTSPVVGFINGASGFGLTDQLASNAAGTPFVGALNSNTGATSTDRALGTGMTGAGFAVAQLALTNTLSTRVDLLSIGYDTRLLFVSGAEEVPGYLVFVGVASAPAVPALWSPVPALFSNGITNTDSVLRREADVGVTVLPGQTLFIRFIDDNAVAISPDNAYAIDGVRVALPGFDAGLADAGLADAGTPDAGLPDAGLDADGGRLPDAGPSFDAGAVSDGGVTTEPEADGGRRGDATSLRVGAGCAAVEAGPLLVACLLLARRRRPSGLRRFGVGAGTC